MTDADTCHVCGDSGEAGDVVKSYREGEIMKITVQFTHGGYQTVNQFRICPESGSEDWISMPRKLVNKSLIGSDPDEECFESHPLLTSEGETYLNISSVENIINQEVNLIMLIPENVTCQRFN